MSDRKQLVTVNGVDSEEGEVSCGVPQGSLLGPLLFLVYVNDIQLSINPDCKILLYADDTALLYSHRDPTCITRFLSQELESCHDWLVDNKLSLHVGKTEFITFGPKRKIAKVYENDHYVSCYGNKIKLSKTVKYLGVSLDSSLSGEAIVTTIAKKAGQRLKFLYRNKDCMSFDIKKTLSLALIQCYLDYASVGWFECLNKKLKNKMQVIQNKIVRFIHGYPPRRSLVPQDFKRVGILKVEDRVKQLRLNHVFKIHMGLAPDFFCERFSRLNTRYGTRASRLDFFVPRVQGIESNTFFFQWGEGLECTPP